MSYVLYNSLLDEGMSLSLSSVEWGSDILDSFILSVFDIERLVYILCNVDISSYTTTNIFRNIISSIVSIGYRDVWVIPVITYNMGSCRSIDYVVDIESIGDIVGG